MKNQQSVTAAAAAVATIAVGGIAPTDPRIQPFMRIAKEEWMDLRVRVLMSNGMSEALARQEIERSMPADKSYFFGQALMKYISSLSTTQDPSPMPPSAFAVPSFNTTPNVSDGACSYYQQAPFSNESLSVSRLLGPLHANSLSQNSANSSGAPTLTGDPSFHNTSTTLNLSSLQRLFEKTPKTASTSSSSATVGNVLATPQTTVAKTKLTRFDVPLQTGPTQLAPSPSSAFYLADNSNGYLQRLDKALQQWTYCVYSVHQTAPVGMDAKAWRSALFQFVNFYVAFSRQQLAQHVSTSSLWGGSASPTSCFPPWLISCQIPTVEQVLEPQKFQEAACGAARSSYEVGVHSTPSSSISYGSTAEAKPLPPSCRTHEYIPPPPPNQTLIGQKSARHSDRRRLAQENDLSPVSSSDTSTDAASTMEGESKTNSNSTYPQGKKKSRQGFSRRSSSMRDSSDSSLEESASCGAAPTYANVLGKTGRSVVYQKRETDNVVENLKGTNVLGANWIPIEKRHKKGSLGKMKLLTLTQKVLKEKDILLYSADERRKREDRSRRFFGTSTVGDGTAAKAATEAGSIGVVTETIRMMTWQEKQAMLNSLERVVGRSQQLEKQYLRLCGPPDPALVRPEHVLVESFRHCLDKWEREKSYPFIEEQFRSIRQDLMVQGIKNAFTVMVYESNAKIALQNSDLGQFNQCQTQLYELYKQLGVEVKAREEFLCYRILYLALTNMNHDLLRLSGEITEEEKKLLGVQFATQCRRALIEGNCNRFFRLARVGPFLTSTLVSIFMNKLRVIYLVLISRAHYEISLQFLQKELHFDTLQECRQFLQENNAKWVHGNAMKIDGRKSVTHFEASPLLQTRKVNALG